MSGTLTLGSLVAFILYAGRFFRPISDMSEKFNTLQAAMASSERIFQLLDTDVAVKNPRQSKVAGRESSVGSQSTVASHAGHIVFDNVSFAYNRLRLSRETRRQAPRRRQGEVTRSTRVRAQKCLVRSEPRRTSRDRRGDRGREVDAHQPAAALLRRHRRTHSDRRRRHPRDGSRRPAEDVRAGAAGRPPLLRNNRGKHPPR